MEIIDYLKRAEELAENVGEKYQEVAYQELLRYFLYGTNNTSNNEPNTTNTPKPKFNI